MRRALVVVVACVCAVMLCATGYCQDDSISQSESQMGSGLQSEINSESAQNTAEMNEANSEFGSENTMTF